MTNRRIFSPKHTIATLGASLLILMAIVMGGGAGFVNVPSLMITFGISFSLLFGIHGRTFNAFLVDGFLTLFSTPPQREINKTYQQITVQFSRYVIGAGALGTLISLIQMLHNMTDPSAIGSGMSIALITVLYAVMASEIYLAFLYYAYAEKPEVLPPMSSKGIVLVAGITATTLILFFAVMISFGIFDNSRPKSEGSIVVSVVVPTSSEPIPLTAWFFTDAPETLNMLRQHTNSLGNAASSFLQSVEPDQLNSSATEKRLELALLDAATSLLNAQGGLSNTVFDVSVCNFESSPTPNAK